jgi:hypothetical protein
MAITHPIKKVARKSFRVPNLRFNGRLVKRRFAITKALAVEKQ